MYGIRLDTVGPDRGHYWNESTHTFSYQRKATIYNAVSELPKVILSKSSDTSSLRLLHQAILAEDDIIYHDAGNTTKADVVFINPEIQLPAIW